MVVLWVTFLLTVGYRKSLCITVENMYLLLDPLPALQSFLSFSLLYGRFLIECYRVSLNPTSATI